MADQPTIGADRAPVSVLGLGSMGRALAGAFLAAGHPTTVWNRTATKARPLVARGATAAGGIGEAVGGADLVVVCVIDYAAAEAIVGPAAEALRGRTLLSLTSDAPQRARRLADWAAAHRVHYLDGAILTPAPTIGGPDAVVLYSGAEQAYRRHEPTLASLGGSAGIWTRIRGGRPPSTSPCWTSSGRR